MTDPSTIAALVERLEKMVRELAGITADYRVLALVSNVVIEVRDAAVALRPSASTPRGPRPAGVPRRSYVPEWNDAERAIAAAVEAVERMPPDVRLTDAVVLLQAARESVADYQDGVSPKRRYVREELAYEMPPLPRQEQE